ncbi:MAG: histidine kinase [Oscillospiraceae bacterium]|jgi:two-component system sensor histidine kinase YesM|nr:histidine kinase [Oscillospiraceae bacterium]
MERQKRRRSMRTLALRMALLLLVLPALAVSALFMVEVERNAIADRDQLLNEYAAQVVRSLDSILEEMQRIGGIHRTRYDILLTLRRDYAKDPTARHSDLRVMADLIGAVTRVNPRIYRMAIIGRYGQIYAGFASPYLEDIAALEDRAAFVGEKGSGMMLFPPVAYENGESGVYIPMVMEMRDPDTNVVVGYMNIDIDYSEIAAVFSAKSPGASLNVLILNETGVLYDSAVQSWSAGECRESAGSQALVARADDGTWGRTVRVQNDGRWELYDIRAVDIADKGLSVVVYASQSEGQAVLGAHALTYAAFTALFVAAAALLFNRVFNGFMRQINILRASMRDAQDGRALRIQRESGILEIQSLYDSYNSMADQIVSSIKSEYELRLMNKKAQMDVLLLQVNPHFLYNTLSLIRSIAQCRREEEIERVSVCLSAMLRYTLAPEGEVMLEDEIKQVWNYITIQQIRFPNSITVDQDCDPELTRRRVMRFIMQPIVENAFKHALERKKGERRLGIRVIRRQRTLVIVITDNGEGIPPLRLEALRASLRRSQSAKETLSLEDADSTGIGLLNVHRRLVFAYGCEYGLSIDSAVGGGTAVSIRLPLSPDERAKQSPAINQGGAHAHTDSGG